MLHVHAHLEFLHVSGSEACSHVHSAVLRTSMRQEQVIDGTHEIQTKEAESDLNKHAQPHTIIKFQQQQSQGDLSVICMFLGIQSSFLSQLKRSYFSET